MVTGWHFEVLASYLIKANKKKKKRVVNTERQWYKNIPAYLVVKYYKKEDMAGILALLMCLEK